MKVVPEARLVAVTALTLPAFVAGHAIRTTNAVEGSDSGLIPGLWTHVVTDERLLGLPGRADDRLYAVLFDYESDENGAYTQVVGIGINDPAALPSGVAVVSPGVDERVEFQVRGQMPAALIESWGEVWRRSANGTLVRTFAVDIEVHQPDGSVALLIAGQSA